MNDATIILAGETLVARPSGALHWPRASVLVVGDLHLGRAERLARLGASLLPPYETTATLDRLAAEVETLDPRMMICLGDSFDDDTAGEMLVPEARQRLAALAEGRDWLWITGNHDPRSGSQRGRVAGSAQIGPLAFRHIAEPAPPPAGCGEVSAHYHPKAHLSRLGARIARPCFLADGRRIVLPAFGTYTGGLDARDPVFDPLFDDAAEALMTGRRVTAIRRKRLG